MVAGERFTVGVLGGASLGQAVEGLDPTTLAIGIEIASDERTTLDQSLHFATSPGDEVETGDPLTTFLRTIGR